MIPTIYDICVKNVLTIDICKTLEEAVIKLSSSSLRTIVLVDKENNNYHILTTALLLEYRLTNIEKDTSLKKLNIPKAKELDKNLNLLSVLNHIEYSNEYMVITEKNKLLGIVSYTDIINNIDPQLMMEKQTVSSLIHQYKAVTTNENITTLEAIKLLKDSARDAILILDEKNKAKGIFTTKDFIDLLYEDNDLSKPIRDFMTSPVDTVSDNTTISQAINYIKEKHYKRIVVVNKKGFVAGIITQKELLKNVYNKWIELIKEEGSRVSKTNEKLLKVTCELEKKASIDFLTKLYNRTKFEEILEEQEKIYKENSSYNFSLIIMDIDNFKSINDSFGHLFGDDILQKVAKILTASTRTTDILARWGGEEFVLILPNTDIEQAAIAAQKIRVTIEKFDFENNLKITCSFGVSQFHQEDSKIAIFKRADDAVYRAKNLGKNRVELESLL